MGKQIIYNGFTFKYFYLGAIIAFVSVIWLTNDDTHRWLGGLGIFIAISYALCISITIINYSKKKITTIKLVIALDMIKQYQTNDFDRVELVLNNQSQTLNARSVSNTIKVRSYHISLVRKDKSKIELQEFTDYQKAVNLLNTVSSSLNIKKIDRLELVKSIKRRR